MRVPAYTWDLVWLSKCSLIAPKCYGIILKDIFINCIMLFINTTFIIINTFHIWSLKQNLFYIIKMFYKSRNSVGRKYLLEME